MRERIETSGYGKLLLQNFLKLTMDPVDKLGPYIYVPTRSLIDLGNVYSFYQYTPAVMRNSNRKSINIMTVALQQTSVVYPFTNLH